MTDYHKKNVADRKDIDKLLSEYPICEKLKVTFEASRYDILFSIREIELNSLIFRVRTCEDDFLNKIKQNLIWLKSTN